MKETEHKDLTIHKAIMCNKELTPAEKVLAALLSTKPVWTVAQLADALQVSRVTVYRLLNTLKEKGVVTTSETATDASERGCAYTVSDKNGNRIFVPDAIPQLDPNRHIFGRRTK